MTVAKKKEWYLEYEITVNRAGLLGDVSSLLGMLGISTITINGVDQGRRGLLIKADSLEKVTRFEDIIRGLKEVEITKLRIPELRDRLAACHGRYIEQDIGDKRTFRFEREDLGLLVDFLTELSKEDGHKLIGIKGMSCVGRTESIVAGSVRAHKRWLFISSTLIRQAVRSSLVKGEYDANHVYTVDGAVTAREANPKHQQLVEEVMTLPSIRVVEHPDLFIETNQYSIDDFDYIIELRERENQKIEYDHMRQQVKQQAIKNKNILDFGESMFGGGFGFFE